MRETWVWSLGWEDPLEKETATHSNIFPWRSPWTEKPGRLQSMESQKVGHDWATFTFTFILGAKDVYLGPVLGLKFRMCSFAPSYILMGFPSGSAVKNPWAMKEMPVPSLGWEDPLKEGMAMHSSILAWRIPVDRGAWWATVHMVTKSWTQLKQPSTHTCVSFIKSLPLRPNSTCVCGGQGVGGFLVMSPENISLGLEYEFQFLLYK